MYFFLGTAPDLGHLERGKRTVCFLLTDHRFLHTDHRFLHTDHPILHTRPQRLSRISYSTRKLASLRSWRTGRALVLDTDHRILHTDLRFLHIDPTFLHTIHQRSKCTKMHQYSRVAFVSFGVASAVVSKRSDTCLQTINSCTQTIDSCTQSRHSTHRSNTEFASIEEATCVQEFLHKDHPFLHVSHVPIYKRR